MVREQVLTAAHRCDAASSPRDGAENSCAAGPSHDLSCPLGLLVASPCACLQLETQVALFSRHATQVVSFARLLEDNGNQLVKP